MMTTLSPGEQSRPNSTRSRRAVLGRAVQHEVDVDFGTAPPASDRRRTVGPHGVAAHHRPLALGDPQERE